MDFENVSVLFCKHNNSKIAFRLLTNNDMRINAHKTLPARTGLIDKEGSDKTLTPSALTIGSRFRDPGNRIRGTRQRVRHGI